MLNRTITWVDGDVTKEHLRWEADERHIHVFCDQLGFKGDSKSRATPIDKQRWSKLPPLLGNELAEPLRALF
eukprot:9335041-Karenia_brevis.AAC.1